MTISAGSLASAADVNAALAGKVNDTGDTITGTLNLTGSGTALAVTNNATVGGSATVGGTLGVTGAVTLSGGVSQSTTVTLAGNTTNNAASSGNLALQIFNGTNSVAVGANLNSLTINDHLNWTGASNGVTGYQISHNYGPGNVGGRTAHWSILNQTAATTDLADNFYVASCAQGFANFNNGGSDVTFGTAKGRLFGSNPTARLKSGATNYFQVTGMEINAQIDTGASAMVRNFLSIATLGASTIQGALVDAGVWFYSASGALLKTGVLFGAGGVNNWPIDPAGTIISASAGGSVTVAAAIGIDFSAVAFSQTPLKMPLLTNAANDTAAATASVPIGGFYRNGSIVMQRVS